jgi:NAD(P)-dependent dehydrogenase (short-subunit alcohol dehydrogenase family)
MTPNVTERRMEMLLENKNAIIYGAGGAIGGAVARAFAREGAKAFLTGRTIAKVEAVAKDIIAAGGTAEYGIEILPVRSCKRVESRLRDIRGTPRWMLLKGFIRYRSCTGNVSPFDDTM